MTALSKITPAAGHSTADPARMLLAIAETAERRLATVAMDQHEATLTTELAIVSKTWAFRWAPPERRHRIVAHCHRLIACIAGADIVEAL